jgi:hypothetical protein
VYVPTIRSQKLYPIELRTRRNCTTRLRALLHACGVIDSSGQSFIHRDGVKAGTEFTLRNAHETTHGLWHTPWARSKEIGNRVRNSMPAPGFLPIGQTGIHAETHRLSQARVPDVERVGDVGADNS